MIDLETRNPHGTRTPIIRVASAILHLMICPLGDFKEISQLIVKDQGLAPVTYNMLMN